MNPEELWTGITPEEVEAIREAARIWAERVRIAYEEAAEAISRILSVLGTPDLEALDDLQEEIEKEPVSYTHLGVFRPDRSAKRSRL